MLTTKQSCDIQPQIEHAINPGSSLFSEALTTEAEEVSGQKTAGYIRPPQCLPSLCLAPVVFCCANEMLLRNL